MLKKRTKLSDRVASSPKLTAAYRLVEDALSGLSSEEVYLILSELSIWNEVKRLVSPPSDDLDASLERAYEEALLAGLRSGNAAMVGRYQEYRAERAAQKKMSNIVVNITPYRIADASLPRIVLQGEDEIVAQIEAALQRRKLHGRVKADDPAVPFDPEDSGQ